MVKIAFCVRNSSHLRSVFPGREVARKDFSLLFLLIYCLLRTVPAQSTTLQTASLKQLAQGADLIVRGRIVEVKSEKSVDRASIVTRIKVSVDRQWKGPKLAAVTLRQPGGSVGEITQAVSGLPQFSLGEDVLVFLEKQEDGSLATVGGKQGKFAVKTDPQSGKEIIVDVTGKSQPASNFLTHLQAALK
jgi:hypothetical protein